MSAFRLALLVGLVIFGGAAAWAADKPETLEVSGWLVDNACVEAHRGDLPAFLKTHAKDCLLKPENAQRGYSLFTPDGEVTEFSAGSQAKLTAYLRQAKSKPAVTLRARLEDQKLVLLSVQGYQKPKSGSTKK